MWILCLEYYDRELRPSHVNFQRLAKLKLNFVLKNDKMIHLSETL